MLLTKEKYVYLNADYISGAVYRGVPVFVNIRTLDLSVGSITTLNSFFSSSSSSRVVYDEELWGSNLETLKSRTFIVILGLL